MPACSGCTDPHLPLERARARPRSVHGYAPLHEGIHRVRPSVTHDISRRWQLLAIVLVIGFLIWLLAPVLMPFAVAGMLAYLGDPLADRLERLGMNRTWAVSIVFFVLVLLLVGALLLLVPLISDQIGNLIHNLPRYVDWFQNTALPWVQRKLSLDPDAFDTSRLMAAIRAHIGSIGAVATTVLGTVSRSSLGAVMWLTNVVLVPVVAFYLLRDWDRLIAYIDSVLPRSVQPTVAHLARESDAVLGAFVRGQLLVMLALGIFYGVALTLVGLSVGPLIGMVAGLLSFVPYLGFMVGCGVFVVGQLLEGYVLVPKLVGDKIGLHPVAVIFAVLAGGYLFGFLGVLLALPAASVIMVLLRYLLERYRLSELYTESGHEDPVIAEVDVTVDTPEGTAQGSAAVPAQRTPGSDGPP